MDVKYIYGDTRLKEEIWLSQQARNNLPNPASFGINPNNAYLVFVTRIDLDRALPAFAGNVRISQNDYEGDGRIDFTGIRGEVKFFLPVDWAFRDVDRDTLNQDNMLKIRKRLIHPDGNHFLLTGVKLRDLINMPGGTIVFDPQVELNYQPNAIGGYDTFIYAKNFYSVRAGWNYGAYNEIRVGRSNHASYDRKRTLIQFDLSGIPANAAINTAELSFYCWTTYSGTTSSQLNVHKMLTYWEEGILSGTTGDASWNNRTSANAWGTGGGLAGTDYNSSVIDYVTKAQADTATWFTWDIKSLVEDWVGDAENNLGLMVKYKDDHISTGTHRMFRFYSSDETTADTLRPKLKVNYTEDFATVYYVRDAAGNVIATYRK